MIKKRRLPPKIIISCAIDIIIYSDFGHPTAENIFKIIASREFRPFLRPPFPNTFIKVTHSLQAAK